MLTILIPCAGEGRRFKEKGYELPKPLIPVHGMPMLRRVVENVTPDCECRWVFVTDHAHDLYQQIERWCPRSSVIGLHRRTDGAARTCLQAKPLINVETPLLIANCDQLIAGSRRWLRDLVLNSSDSAILTMKGDGTTKWSYVDVWFGVVSEVVEKEPISDRATCGIYWWAKGSDFVRSAELMIAAEEKVNGEYYVAPTFNYLISQGMSVAEVRVETCGAVFHGLGTPEDLELYLKGEEDAVRETHV